MFNFNEDKNLSDYEKEQLTKIEKWKNEEPGVISKALGTATAPLSWFMRKVIPKAAIKGVLDGANEVGRVLADKKQVVKTAQVTEIEDLRYLDLRVSDKLAEKTHKWAVGIAAAEGGATGATGLPGTAVDIPAVITLALRTIHRVGLCYGYECKTEEDKQIVLGILAASGANSMEEKLASLTMIRSVEKTLATQTWKKIARTAAEKPLSKESGIMLIKKLASQLGINLTKRKALQVVPIVGALVGSSSNAWFIKDVSLAARRVFQERWLKDNDKIIDQ